MDNVALLLLRNLKEGTESGRISDMKTAQAEIEAAIESLSCKRQPEDSSDLIGKLFLEVGSLREKVNQCEAQLAEFRSQTKILKEDTMQVVARTEACNSLVEQQQKENARILATIEAGTSDTPYVAAPATFHTDPPLRLGPSRAAVVSFPGGPRTITIHPPDSPHHQSVVRDEKGDVIIDFRCTKPKPLRREGAFKGPIEEIDWLAITRVCGRGHESRGPRPPPPRCPDPVQQPCPTRPRGTSDIIARQTQLSKATKTDELGHVLPSDLLDATPPLLPTGMSSSLSSSQDSQSSLGAKPDPDTPSSTPTPSSPSAGRSKKRARNSELCELVPSANDQEPKKPTTVKREVVHPPEGPSKRKKLRASLEKLADAPITI